MAKPFRSPLLGYNHNISHLGRVFHVQSEDSGPVAPRLFTHLFFEGTILVSRKCEYDGALADDKVRALMQAQHKTVMKDLMQSRLDERIVAFFAARGEDLSPLLNARAAAMAAAAAAPIPDGMPGALPRAPLRETPEPVMVLTDVQGLRTDGRGTVGATSAAPVAPVTAAAPAPIHDPAEGIPANAPRRRTAAYQRTPAGGGQLPLIAVAPPAPGSSPSPRPAEPPGRPPFVRSGTPGISRVSTASADGVVVQRNVVIGGGAGSPSRPARIRPPIPYVVTGGGHTERPPQPVPSPLAPLSGATGIPVSNASPAATAPVSAVEPHRTTGAFGVPIGDDKSLDEVILEYLSEDGDPT